MKNPFMTSYPFLLIDVAAFGNALSPFSCFFHLSLCCCLSADVSLSSFKLLPSFLQPLLFHPFPLQLPSLAKHFLLPSPFSVWLPVGEYQDSCLFVVWERERMHRAADKRLGLEPQLPGLGMNRE